MPDVDLETLTNVNEPSALDPFGLLSDRERSALTEMLSNDDSLPTPGSVLPLSWDPTPPAGATTPQSPRLCVACRRLGRSRIGHWIVGRNIGRRLDNHIPVGSVVCGECRNRRLRFYDRYNFYRTSGYCSNHPLEYATAYVTYLEPNRGIRGFTLCALCERNARNDGTRVRSLRYG